MFANCSNLTNVKFGLSCENITFWPIANNSVFEGVNPDISFLYPSYLTDETFQTKVLNSTQPYFGIHDISYSNFQSYP